MDYTENIMIKQAELIATEYREVGEMHQSISATLERVALRVKVLDSYLDATTWIVGKDYKMQMASGKEESIILDRKLANPEVIQKVLEGNIISQQTGFEQYFTTPVLTIGYPIEIAGNVEFALFIHTPMPQILTLIDEVRSILAQAVLITTSIILVLVYFTSKRMSKPLKEMNQVAKKIANGDFAKRIDVDGVDEIAQLGESLNYMAEELDKIDSNRKAFIANVSHDMRSPLTSISGFVTAILDGTIPDEKHDKYLRIVLNESQRMIKMTNDILELSRMEEGNLPLKKMEFNLHEMIRDLLDNFEHVTKEKEVNVNVLFDKKEQIVFADPEKIARVVQNLLDNAFKFVNNQGTIEIETVAKQNKVWVYIRNSGPSISKEDQKSIWERFYKSDLSRGKDKTGMGIGLVIVKETMRQHNEELGIISNEGELVNFYFTLSKV
ncbi:sensor histidine kinase [Niameybacter sp.]|uniref:sensor histidine kinase n=2 Tax=Niameybacter sp. TaxID=2033640 RepID=UPI002FCB5D55